MQQFSIGPEDPISLSIIARRLRRGEAVLFTHRGVMAFVISVTKAAGGFFSSPTRRPVEGFYSVALQSLNTVYVQGQTLSRGEATAMLKFSTTPPKGAPMAHLYVTLLEYHR